MEAKLAISGGSKAVKAEEVLCRRSSMNYKYENRKDFVFKICRLGLWYLNCHTCGEESFHEILDRQLPIYRLTTLWDGKNHPANSDFPRTNSQWCQLADELQMLYKDNKLDSLVFEEKGFDLLYPYIKGRIQTDIEKWPWIPCGYSPHKLPKENIFDIFAYEDIESADQRVVYFHIANICMPESPFKDMNARAHGLLNMVKAIKQRFPSVEKIECDSWLNSFEPFLKLFPASYPQKNEVQPKVGYGFNWWGQFLSRDGSFHNRHGKIMRQTGKFPFVSRTGICDIDNVEKYLLLKL